MLVDTFNRADSTSVLGTTSDGTATWVTQTGTWGISSNKAYQSSATGGDLMATVDAGVSDGILQVTLATIPTSLASKRPALLFWYQNTTNFFMFQATPGGYTVWQVVGGTATVEGSISTTPASGDVVKVRLSGHTIDYYLNGTHGGTHTNASYGTATKHGLYTSSADTSTRFDDFSLLPLPLRGWVVGAIAMN